MKVRRRGRPSVGERVPLGLRVTPEMKRRLDAAARQSGRSQSQEAEFRLERSFDHEDLLPQVLKLAYGDEPAELLMQLGSCLKMDPSLGSGAFIFAADRWLRGIDEGVTRDAKTNIPITYETLQSAWAVFTTKDIAGAAADGFLKALSRGSKPPSRDALVVAINNEVVARARAVSRDNKR